MPNPYPAPVSDPNAPYQSLLQAIRSGYSPTLPNCPEINESPDVIAAKIGAPPNTHIRTAQGHKVT